MLGRERVLAAFAHEEADRVPRTIWMFREDVREAVAERHGSVDAFFDFLDIDSFQTFPSKGMWPGGVGGIDDALDATLTDPDDEDIYRAIRHDVEFQKGQKGRAVFCQTPGVFETSNGVLGIENSLTLLAMEPDKCHALYEKIARWAAIYARNCLDVGVDIVHISDEPRHRPHITARYLFNQIIHKPALIFWASRFPEPISQSHPWWFPVQRSP